MAATMDSGDGGDGSRCPGSPAFRWGVLATARTAAKRTLPAMLRAGHAVVAICGRSERRLEEFRRDFGILRTYPESERAHLLADPDVDAIYVPLPNSLHASWVVRSLTAKKHVFCEKPMALGPAEVEEILSASDANRRFVDENFSYPLTPGFQFMLRRKEELGPSQPTSIDVDFSFQATSEHRIRFDRSLGGGSFFDLGCYGVDFVHRVLGEPLEILGVDVTPLPSGFGGVVSEAGEPVDGECRVSARSRSGVRVSLASSFLKGPSQSVTLSMANGEMLRLPRAFRVEDVESRVVHVDRGGRELEKVFPKFDADRAMLCAFASQASRNEPVATDVRERWRRNAAVLAEVHDAVRAALERA